ncbi:UNVERIFIED_CONTAM: VanZ family protein [Bacteroidetes bacterium 56_B9]
MNEKLKQKSVHALLLAFVVASILFLLPDASVDHDSGFTSSDLEVKETMEENVTNTSYVNSDGVITDAINMGYATVQRTRNANVQVTEEFYLDAAGNPVERYGDYYGISYEYNSENVVIRYLGADKQPMMLGAGYSTIVRTLVDGKATDDLYYDLNMQPVQCIGGYYSLHREYDGQGLNCAITYFDANGQPVICTAGYAVKTYQRDTDGTVIGEQYFDTEENPARSSLGQYGELYQRDEQGRISRITYLGADGNTAPTTAGYTILKRTYHRDGTADTDMYFDADGNPMALSKGQYGIKHSGKVNLLLDKNGHVMLCVDNILNGFPFMVVISGCVICLLILVLPKKMSVLLTAAYVAFILYETLMFRESGDARTNFVLFSYADRFLTEQSVRVGVINNVWLFVPLGAGLYRIIQKKWVLLVPFFMSVAIETTQYITGLGIAEFDDVFGNTMGGWIGVLTAWVWLSWRKSCMDEQKTEEKKSKEKKRWQKLLLLLIEKVIEKAWYIVLLTISTIYLAINRFAIEKLDDASMLSTVFIIWVVLLVLPLFSELEFLGVKVKKEVKKAVEKSNEEVKASIHNLQQIVSQIQVSNSVAPQFTINSGSLPSEERIDNLIKEIRLLNEQNTNKQTEKQDKVNIPTQNIELFKMRYGIEVKLNDALDLIGYNGKNHISLIQSANYLSQQGVLDPTSTDLLIQVVRIANRGVHGEIIGQKYLDFASEAYPKIIDALDDCIELIKKMT